jgi:hypothetical protein
VAYSDLLTEIQRGVPAGDYEVFSFDLAWMKELALNGYMQELSDLLDIRQSRKHFVKCFTRALRFSRSAGGSPVQHDGSNALLSKDLFEQL